MAKDALTLAWNDMRKRHFATAIKRLESKSEIYEENFEYYLAIGVACLYVGDIGAASSYFQMARRIRLTDSRLLLGQAAIFLRHGDTARALQYYLDITKIDPSNKTALAAMEFIRRIQGDYDTICRWVDTGRIEQFYPPLGVNYQKFVSILIPVFACVLGCAVAVTFFPRHQNPTGPRADLSDLVLTDEEKSSAQESDLSTQSYKFVFSDKEITKKYNSALKYFQEGRDNAAQKEVNTILNSNAALSIKQKSRILASYFEIPDFNTIKDVPALQEVKESPYLYYDCWVDWGGKISNTKTYDDSSFSCSFLIGDENLEKYDGTVTVKFDSVPSFNSVESVKILGKLTEADGELCIMGRAVYQSPKK
ncbi:MAG: hypothetical protein K6A89_10665 [Treponema sp.]|nr:hypothetical protein [Treponema sp.]